MTRRRQKRRIANGEPPPEAVTADPSQQVPLSPYGSPKPFYVDVEFTCRDCGRHEVWSASQQKWYYEVAKGTLYATAVRCRDCRKRAAGEKERQRQQMADAKKRETGQTQGNTDGEETGRVRSEQ